MTSCVRPKGEGLARRSRFGSAKRFGEEDQRVGQGMITTRPSELSDSRAAEREERQAETFMSSRRRCFMRAGIGFRDLEPIIRAHKRRYRPRFDTPPLLRAIARSNHQLRTGSTAGPFSPRRKSVRPKQISNRLPRTKHRRK